MITNIKVVCGFIRNYYINIYNNKPYQLANLKTSISWQFSGLESEREMGNFYKIYVENYASIEKYTIKKWNSNQINQLNQINWFNS